MAGGRPWRRWQLRTWRAEVIRRVAHPGRGFTQGLIADDGMVYESTGRYGVSALCRYPLGADQAEQRAEVPAEFFAEGICRVGDVIWQLTWRERTALKWDAATLELIDRVPYNREGWGICAAGDYVMTSDGSSELVRRDPQAIMNGIAALPEPGEFLLTGKGWRWIRHVRLKPAREGSSRRRLLAGLSY